jgi:hypothetical protein
LTGVRKFRPALKLARTLAEPGGIDPARALAQAARNLDSVREYCAGAIDAKIERIAALSMEQDGAAEIYDLANEIFGEAGALGFAELSAAAHSLCSLLSTPTGARSPAALAVHVDALRRLRSASAADNAEVRVALLSGLRAVAARFAS